MAWTPHACMKVKCAGCPTTLAGPPYILDGGKFCTEYCAWSHRWLKKFSYFTKVEVDPNKYLAQRRKRK